MTNIYHTVLVVKGLISDHSMRHNHVSLMIYLGLPNNMWCIPVRKKCIV